MCFSGVILAKSWRIYCPDVAEATHDIVHVAAAQITQAWSSNKCAPNARNKHVRPKQITCLSFRRVPFRNREIVGLQSPATTCYEHMQALQHSRRNIFGKLCNTSRKPICCLEPQNKQFHTIGLIHELPARSWFK